MRSSLIRRIEELERFVEHETRPRWAILLGSDAEIEAQRRALPEGCAAWAIHLEG